MTVVSVTSPAPRVVKVATTAGLDQVENHVFTFQGPLSAYVGTGRLYIEDPGEIRAVRFSVGTPSPFASTFDIIRNGSGSLFSSAPVLAANANTTYLTTGFAVTELARNDFLTVNINSVNLSQPAADLTVTIRIRRLA